MFRRLFASGIAAALVFIAPSVHAQITASASLFQHFQVLCVDGRADRAAFRQAVQGLNWMQAPEGMIPPDPMMRDPEVWIQSSRSGMYFAFVAEAEYSEGGEVIPMDACGLGTMPPTSDFLAALDTFGGGHQLEGFDTGPNERAYGFIVTNGRAVPAEPMGRVAMARAILNNELNVVMGGTDPEMSLLIYMAPTF